MPGGADVWAIREDGAIVCWNSWDEKHLVSWRLPRPYDGGAERFRLWVELTTQKRIDEAGNLVELWHDRAGIRERYDRLQKLGGPPAP